jgi:hypothetical protein
VFIVVLFFYSGSKVQLRAFHSASFGSSSALSSIQMGAKFTFPVSRAFRAAVITGPSLVSQRGGIVYLYLFTFQLVLYPSLEGNAWDIAPGSEHFTPSLSDPHDVFYSKSAHTRNR